MRTMKLALVTGAVMLAACNSGGDAPAVRSTTSPPGSVVSTTTIAPVANVVIGQFCDDVAAGREGRTKDGKSARCDFNPASKRNQWVESSPVTTTTTTAPPETTTTTEAPPPVTEPPPPPTTTTIVPGGPDDPYGPILCPGLRHPAHHYPCPEKTTATTALPRTQSVGEPQRVVAEAPSASLASIVECEDNDDPSAGPTGYASNTGNGYYGGYQWLPSTFNAALGQALKQGKVDQATYDAWYGVRPDKVPSWVQDAAAAAHIAAGGRGAWPNC